jgi:hypothetical protein
MFRSIFEKTYILRHRSTPRPVFRSRWIETADERCPIACNWFLTPEVLKEQDDEPGSTWPVSFLLWWKTGLSTLPWLSSRTQSQLYLYLEA